MNFEEALKKQVDLQHRDAIFEELIDYLDQFIPSDLGEAEAILEVEDCTSTVVSQEAIENIQTMLVNAQQKTNKELTMLAKLRMTDGKKKK